MCEVVRGPITVDLDQVSPDASKIVFAVSIDDAEVRKQNFGQVVAAHLRITTLDGK